MDMQLKERFMKRWGKYFPGASLPVAFFYSDDEAGSTKVKGPKSLEEHRCVLADIVRATRGRSLAFDVNSIGCGGGRKYLGFTQNLRPNFEYFLSYGIPGELEGERYKKSPEMVGKIMNKMPKFDAPAKHIVFKRWDKLEEEDDPDAVIFFGTPDVISGLFTLANFDEIEQNGVFSPFGAGCSTIVTYPYLENNARRPRCVLGMFDVSARPCVPAGTLTFAAPFKKFIRMAGNMDESFLITESWKKVKRRIARNNGKM
ncbi:MAG TPA: DUF169 domain-containing protein [Syntrophorhabdaceae bacterium]|nr:DUF169 domain-containing protein [Syntrophorhabdaceae bacterium]